MKRTRKWSFVEQEAKRLADLGLSGYAIAKKLEVNAGTVSRWVAAGKLTLRGGQSKQRVERQAVVVVASTEQTPAQWAAAVRAEYSLDATDEQLVTAGESALLISRDPGVPTQLRLQAMGRFQSVAKQLALLARRADEKPVDEPKRKTNPVVQRSNGDPRAYLTAV